MKIIYVLTALISLFNYSDASEDVTLVVGNRREPGRLQNNMFQYFGYEKADFSHTTSFKNVTTIDAGEKPKNTRLSHIQGDFLTYQFPRNKIIRRIMFEWFPSNNRQTHFPLLVEAVKRAIAILPEGGELIIDHFPYVTRLPSGRNGLGILIKNIKKDDPYICELEELMKNKTKEKDTKVADLWQTIDPFTHVIDLEELREIQGILFNIFSGKKTR